MARNDDLSDNELDAFDSKREQILLDEAGDYANESSDVEDSEEEVMGLKSLNESASEGEEEADAFEDDEEEEQDEDGGWGSKRNYYGGEDLSDDEDGKEMAEEALRQQKKHLQELNVDDFVDEDMMGDWKKAAEEHDTAAPGAVAEEEEVDFHSLEDEDKLKHLNGSFPEFTPLLNEFVSLSPQLESFKQDQASPVVRVKFVALSAYLSSISSYLSMFVDNLKSKSTFSMKDSPVMESILSSREVWRQANELRVQEPQESEEESEEQMEEIEQSAESDDEPMEQGALATDSEQSEDEEEEEEESSEEEIELNPLAKRTIKTPAAAAASDFTEAATPDSIDGEDKRRRRKTLRFYTSKIDQAAQKNAKNEKFNGDSDLPYRERLFERQQRLIEEARKRGLGLDKAGLGDDLDGDDVGSADEQTAREIKDDAGEYYESIKQAKTAKKDARQEAHKLAKKAAREGKLAELQESLGEDGKRALNFQIQKNKGLTPNRRNDNRNARVKKRKKYEQAKKKLKSVRQVYDQNNRGPYEGEKTGIKKNVSRSVKFA